MNLFGITFIAVAVAAILGTSYVPWRGYAPDTAGRSVALRTGSGGTSGFFGFGRIK